MAPFVADLKCYETFVSYRNQQLSEFFARLDIGDVVSGFHILNEWVALYEREKQLAYGPWRLTWAYGYAAMSCVAAQIYLYSGETGEALNSLEDARWWLNAHEQDEVRGLSKGWNDVRCSLLTSSGLLLMLHPELATASPVKLGDLPALQKRCLSALPVISSAATRKVYRDGLDLAMVYSLAAQLLHGRVKKYEQVRRRLIRLIGTPLPEQPPVCEDDGQRAAYWFLAQVLEAVGERRSRSKLREFAEQERSRLKSDFSENSEPELSRAQIRTDALLKHLGAAPSLEVIEGRRVS